MNLELLARFEAQARIDHIQRILILLTDIDLEQKYSKQPGLLQQLAVESTRLHGVGVHGAYRQSCVLYALLRLELSLDSLLQNESAENLHVSCLQKCLESGVSPSVFQYLHQHLAGITQADRAWVDASVESDGLLIASGKSPASSTISLECDHDGPTTKNIEEKLDSRANFFQTKTGFQHAIDGSYTATVLLREVCSRTWPPDASVISLEPTPLQCVLGVREAGRTELLQQIDLLDARQCKLDCSKQNFGFNPEVFQRLNALWRRVDLLNNCSVDCPATLIHGDFVCQAGWHYPAGKAVFRIQGQACFKWLEDALHWNASLQHDSLQVGLSVFPESAQQAQWSFDEHYSPGQLKVGEPFTVRQQTIPLVASLSSVVSPGKPVIAHSGSRVGEVTLALQGCVNPQSGRLEFQLSLKHSAINCHWQSFDPLRGPMQGHWSLLPETNMCTWRLSNG